MSGRVYEVLPDLKAKGWRLQRRETGESIAYSTKMEAVARGRAFCKSARPAELVVHDRTGRIEEKRQYGAR